MKCPSCDVDMEPLVEGIYQCPQCKKIIKEKIEKKEEKKLEKIEGEFEEAESFPKLNPQYEIVEKGITITKTPNRWIAVLICHNPLLKSDKYVRISWWKKSFYRHGGMFKIFEKDVLSNTIKALEKIDNAFDEVWGWHGKYGRKEEKTEEDLARERKIDIIKYRIIENKTCPKCQKKMNKKKSHYECPHCGEIVILEGYNQPIFNIPSTDLKLQFQSDLPINYYMPVSGITVKWLMGEWKALAVIYDKNNPNKKWLRFYWWIRNLQNVLKYGRKELGEGTKMGWKAQKGVSSPNLYNKGLIEPIIEALKKCAKDLNWSIQ
ncbi:MAG: hypothetical protein GF383_06400 [Candidatus Lokiarchaeota archaeon]|nr:hypothetical protein [Candidatus Lokiarchaeota archaeon]MBD3339667.1 hypothetical protein [Candidatus Lokiarchaeota archaeon]